MAAVRCAARRLGGSLLQPTQAAVAEEGRRLVTNSSFMRSRHLSSKPTQAAVAEEGRRLGPSRFMRSRQLSTKHAAHSTRQIQHKEEEELYGALSKANEHHLSAQSTPGPAAPLPLPWRVYSKRARGVLNVACKVTAFVYAGAFLLGITGAGKMLGLGREVVGEDEMDD